MTDKFTKMTNMSKNLKIELNKKRRYDVLNFLADGEYWTTAENIKTLLNVEHLAYVRRFLDTLIRDQFLIKQSQIVNGYSKNYYCITSLGFEFVGIEDEPKKSKLSHLTMYHNELVQRLHIAALKSDKFVTWQTEIVLKRKQEFKSYPDALFNDISIELQRNAYSIDALHKKIGLCLADWFDKKFRQILFVCVDNLTAERLNDAINKVNEIKNSRGENIVVTVEMKAIFKCINYDEFEGFLKDE